MGDLSSDEFTGPIELPDGSLICRPHGLTVCGHCCVDFSFVDETLEYSEDSGKELEREVVELYEQSSGDGQAHTHVQLGLQSWTIGNAQVPCQEDDQSSGKANVAFKKTPSNIGVVPSLRPAARRGSGRVFPTKFTPPSTTSTPQDLFKTGVGRQATVPSRRFIRRNNPNQLLIFADGACLNNGQSNPKAGWAFVFKPDDDPSKGIVSARLENEGPFGDEATQTSNRAELRAIVGALRFRAWHGEGFTKLVFATDSEYVAEGATSWVRSWVRNGWKTRAGGEVKNKDLWETLLGEFERSDDGGLKIQFWRIPRALNGTADRAAKQAAGKGDKDRYADILGIAI
ncbi:hypothetical protein HIM_12471 [Hirsutella minnesotensis 3608]|uniref:ribonuclease H n=1 Tax=Hirsutella minnesotensis 3608 TaxID=1043627 RepID=A0A0F7ZQM8_9HYPO|nr:hypothetical protein HIM_12471 [Hirsutella minnesotensis 3608]